jgi:hypothetical protein
MPKPKFIIEEPTVEPIKKKGRKPKAVLDDDAKTVEDIPAKKKGRKPKAVLDDDAKTITDTSSKKISYILDNSAPSELFMAETKEEPLIVKKVHKIVLTKFMHSGKYYYLDTERDKLYTYTGDQQHGDYVGRWDSHLEKIITNAEDSDLE